MSRVQDFSFNMSVNKQAIEEIGNVTSEDFYTTNANGSVSIDTNEYGSCRNLRSMLRMTGLETISIDSFDGPTTDFSFEVEERSGSAILPKRSLVLNDCYMDSISWTFSVGGFVSENFKFTADDETWYANDNATAVSFEGYYPTINSSTSEGDVYIRLNDGASYTPIKQYIDHTLVTGALGQTNGVSGIFPDGDAVKVSWTDENFTVTGSRYRTVMRKNTPLSSIKRNTSRSPIGGINRGMLNLYLTTGLGDIHSLTNTNILKLQSADISISFGRTDISELCNYRIFDSPVNYPIPVKIKLDAFDSDLETWGKLINRNYNSTSGFVLEDFTRWITTGEFIADTAKFKVEIYNDVDSNSSSRTLLKSFTITGLSVESHSYSVSVGGIPTQSFSLVADNIEIVGSGQPWSVYPMASDGGLD
jgi:hypothetical protein